LPPPSTVHDVISQKSVPLILYPSLLLYILQKFVVSLKALLIVILEVNYRCFMYEYMQFALIGPYREIEMKNEEFGSLIPNMFTFVLFEFQ
jgi:hypothetical protein